MREVEESAERVSEQSSSSGCDEHAESTSIDPDTIRQLRQLERNTIATEGTVIETFLIDYSAGATPDDAVDAVAAALTDEKSSGLDRLLPESQSVIRSEYERQHAFVLVELPSGECFIDRVFVPDQPDISTPERNRYRSFVSEYGDIDLLAQLEGQQVQIEYDAGNWQLRLTEEQSEQTVPETLSIAGTVVFGAVFTVLVAVGLLAAAGTPTAPSLGAITPRSALLATMLLLLIAGGIEVIRTGLERTLLDQKRGTDD